MVAAIVSSHDGAPVAAAQHEPVGLRIAQRACGVGCCFASVRLDGVEVVFLRDCLPTNLASSFFLSLFFRPIVALKNQVEGAFGLAVSDLKKRAASFLLLFVSFFSRASAKRDLSKKTEVYQH